MLNLRTFTIKRLVPVSTGSKKMTYVATGGMVSGMKTSSSPEFTAIVDGEFGKTFTLFSDDTEVDIKIGDLLVDGEGDAEYNVKGVSKVEDTPGRKIRIIMTLPIDQ
jgi:hypothetical protein